MLQLITFFYFYETLSFILLGVYEEKSLPDVVDLTMRLLQVIESFKNNITDSLRSIPCTSTGSHGFILTKSKSLTTLQKLCTILWSLEDKDADVFSLLMLVVEHSHAKTHEKSL